ncbi:MAG: M15 family metallopeptidase [Nocardioides sp.]|nr:M15 family metallopeptidase [Nocardioides sp.]
MSLVARILTSFAALGLLAAPGLVSPASADAAPTDALVPTTLVLDGPLKKKSGARVQLPVLLSTPNGPLAGAVVVERRVDGVWTALRRVWTDARGRTVAVASQSREPANNVFRAKYAGEGGHVASMSAPVRVAIIMRGTRIRLSGPQRVVDGRRVRIHVSWRAFDGTPIAGQVRLFQRVGKKWKLRRTRGTGAAGKTTVAVRPRTDSRWRAVGVRSAWALRAESPNHRINNLPPGRPVHLPRAAPRPRVKVPAQPRATRPGAAASVSRVPNRVWNNMIGRSWHSGCPVGRAGLRLVRINYWGYDGYRRKGEMVVATAVANNVVGALSEMYRSKFPIRSMHRADRFGYSRALNGGNDYRSMAAGNSSAFNCRNVVNKPGVHSPHAYGGAVDINTWENPYRSRTGIVPNRWWQFHSHPRVAWRSSSHPAVQIMARHGLRWTYGNGDTQHFDASVRGRLVSPRCVGQCH